MFPVMLIGPFCAGLLFTRLTEGRGGMHALFNRIFHVRPPARWYATILIPPVLILPLLIFLERWISPAYTPNRFYLGILFGIPAGLLEEIGWTGFAFPHMQSQPRSHHTALSAAVVLGLLWSLWHLPAVDFLGAASPHGNYLFAFFLAFSLAMTAMRVLIAWIYTNTQSLLLAQLMHISSTGSLVLLSPPGVTPAQEAFWYALYGALLWAVVALVLARFGKRLAR